MQSLPKSRNKVGGKQNSFSFGRMQWMSKASRGCCCCCCRHAITKSVVVTLTQWSPVVISGDLVAPHQIPTKVRHLPDHDAHKGQQHQEHASLCVKHRRTHLRVDSVIVVKLFVVERILFLQVCLNRNSPWRKHQIDALGRSCAYRR